MLEDTKITKEISEKPGLQVNELQSRSAADEETKIAELKARMAQMEHEAEKLREMQEQISNDVNMVGGEPSEQDDPNTHLSVEQRQEIDSRSIFVGNVDFGSTPEELQSYFNECGPINRITIMTNKFTGNPKGYGYIEFSSKDSIPNALQLNDTLFRGRMLKVTEKRTNLPGFSRGGGFGARGRGGFRGRAGFRGRFRGRARGRGGFRPY